MQEYKNRRMYDVTNSRMKKAAAHPVADSVEDGNTKPQNKITYLFTTKTCPNCAMAKEMLTKAEEDYVLIDAEENMELARIRQLCRRLPL